MITYLGEYTIGSMVPTIGTPIAALVGNLQAQLAAAIALQAHLTLTPPSLAGSIDIATKLVVALQASLALNLPGVDFQLTACAALIAKIQAELSILLGLPLATGGLHAFVYDGTVQAFGGEVTTALSSGMPGQGLPEAHCNALVMATTVGATWTAMGGVFKTS